MSGLLSEWRRLRLKHLCQGGPVYGANISAAEYSSGGLRFIRTTDIDDYGKLSSEGVYVLPSSVEDRLVDGDLLLSRSGTIGRSMVYKSALYGPCAYAGYLVRFRPGSLATSRFLFWVTKSAPFLASLSSGSVESTIANFNGQKYADVVLDCPATDPERQAIADFLDRETAEIDALIEKQDAFLALIEERRRSSAATLLFHGTDLNAETDDSGVPWLGRIPREWKVCRAKHVLREVDDRSTDGSEELLTVSHLTGVTPRSEKDVNMFLAETNEGYKRCQPGDLAVNTMWAWMGAMGVSRHHGIISPSYAVYRQTADAFDPRYLNLLVRSPPFVAEVNRNSKGVWTSRMRLYPEALLNLLLPVPPRRVQDAILEAIDARDGQLARLAGPASRLIEALRERRSALITAAVTGQIDVRSTSTAIEKAA